jgi:tetratricopeptide (TPR) repeat protein
MSAPRQSVPRPGQTQSGRNVPCPCGSGRKFKRCCGAVRSDALPVAAADGPPRTGPEPTESISSESASARPFLDEIDTEAGRFARTFLPPRRKFVFPTDNAGARRRDAKATRVALAHLQRGAQLMKDGHAAAAVAVLEQAVRLDPDNAAAHHELGMARLESGRLPAAIVSFRQAIALKPDFARAYYHLAVVLDRWGEWRPAIDAYQQAAELNPKIAEACARIGELITRHEGDGNKAAEWFRRAAAVAPHTSEGRLNRVRALFVEHKFAEVEQELRRLLALAPHHSEGHYFLGAVLSSAGRYADAIDAFERALQADPRNYMAHLALVRDKKLTEADRPEVARLLAALEAWSPDNEGRMFLHFALGKAFDDLREYGEAMHHFDAANALRTRFSTFKPENFLKQIDRVIATYTPDFFARHAHAAAADATPLLIIGMPRSGTTLVEQIVSSHPQVAGAGELMFWIEQERSLASEPAADIPPERAHTMIGRYLSALREVSSQALRVTDKMPFNFVSVGLAHTLFPNARFIHCRRHPVDTCISIYSIYIDKLDLASRKADLVFVYRQYQRLIGHWRRVLPADRLFEVDYETLTATPEPLTRQMIAFCGLDWNDACLRPQDNKRTVQTASHWQVRQPIYRSSIERWRRYEPWLGELGELLPASAAADLPS